ncbi:hypothetical protein GCM10028807_57180 [Spirosoma daeguense]
MKRYQLGAFCFFLVWIALSCEKRLCGCSPLSPVAGEWKLVSITYGLTQKTVTAAEVGYSESLTFSGSIEGGTYLQVRNGKTQSQTSYTMKLSGNTGSEGILYFSADTTQQPFWITDNKLYLSERSPQGVKLADGATYLYQRP